VCTILGKTFEHFDLWYLDSAVEHFKLEEIIKILLIASNLVSFDKNHLNFSLIMNEMYYTYDGMKVKNLFKQRIIEAYLNNLTISDILKGNVKASEHIKFSIYSDFNSYSVKLEFSLPATKLIDFCEVAYGINEFYNQAIVMLYDLFGFRRDKFDRFYNEINYLATMNSTINHKAVIANYIKGDTVVDVGPGGGALLDLIVASNKAKNVIGIDLSENVIEALNQKKQKENSSWSVIKGDALNLDKYFDKNQVDTIIFCSVIHELFSYIETNGKKFNHDTIKQAIRSCYNILPIGGRIIIRDGIMSETNNPRIIVFKDKNDMKFLDKYCHDFKGREIKYIKKNDNSVIMNENDAMEFLYTYTWGEESYPMEVQEQFGYYTPKSYVKMLNSIGNFKIIECKSMLQKGYAEHLLKKIEFYDENMNTVNLPDSTCIIVAEKI